jgi:hypothetical protein
MARSFLLGPPAPGLLRQVEQGGQRAQRRMHHHKTARQQKQHQVERQVYPPGRPEQRDRALVVAGKQCNGHCHAEKGQEPQRGLHG